MKEKAQKLNDKEIAFIDFLTKERQWTFRRLVAELQKIVESDFKNRGNEGSKFTPDYISRILRGQRPASENWNIWIPSAFNLAPTEYLRRYGSFLTDQANSKTTLTTRSTVLPIEYWPHLRWSSKQIAERRIAAKIYGLSKTGINTTFKKEHGEWKVPPGFAGYSVLRQKAWEEFTNNFQRMKKEPPNPEPLWHVSDIHLKEPSSLALTVKLTDYQDVLITSSLKGLNTAIQIDDGRKITVQEWLAEHWISGDPAHPVIPSAHQLVVNLLVLTKDREVVIALQGPDNPDSNGSWATGVSRLVYPKTDSDSYGLPILEKAASSGCVRELGLPVNGEDVKWIAAVAGLKLGSFTFFGVVESKLSRNEILGLFRKNRDLHVKHNLGHEVVDIDFVKIDATYIAERLKIQNYRPYMELGLALLLWLEGEAVIKSN